MIPLDPGPSRRRAAACAHHGTSGGEAQSRWTGTVIAEPWRDVGPLSRHPGSPFRQPASSRPTTAAPDVHPGRLRVSAARPALLCPL